MPKPKVEEQPKRKPGRPKKYANPAENVDRTSAHSIAFHARASRAARDIAPAPDIVNRQRRDAACASLRFFLQTYFPQVFFLEWSADHLAVIAKLEITIKSGGQYALAMSRGSGKTALTE